MGANTIRNNNYSRSRSQYSRYHKRCHVTTGGANYSTNSRFVDMDLGTVQLVESAHKVQLRLGTTDIDHGLIEENVGIFDSSIIFVDVLWVMYGLAATGVTHCLGLNSIYACRNRSINDSSEFSRSVYLWIR